jgi:CHAT domain-containing protein/putative zinc finger protein
VDCSRLYSFLDGELPENERALFEQHFVHCDRCRTAAETAIQLFALGQQLAQRTDYSIAAVPHVGTASAETRPRTTWKVAAAALCVCIVSAVVFVLWPKDRDNALDHIVLALHRSIPERLPYERFDTHRAYDPDRSASPKPENISLDALTQLEKRRDWAGLAAAYISRGEIDAADAVVARVPPDDDIEVSRAIVDDRRGKHNAALEVLDRVLARTPDHPQATWNRALVVAKLGLPLVAAEAFDAAHQAALRRGESGWATEADSRAEELRAIEASRSQAWEQVHAASGALEVGTLPDLELVRQHASIFRPAFLEAVRRASSRDAVEKLRAVAEAIDVSSRNTARRANSVATSGRGAMSGLIAHIAATDFRVRSTAVKVYLRLTGMPAPTSQEKERLLSVLRASGQDDLVLGAISRGGMWHEHLLEYLRLARATADPYLAEVADERAAQARQEAGDPLGAELALREAVDRCSQIDVELRCSYLHMALAKLYLARHRPVEARTVAMSALERSRRLALYWDERLLFDLLSNAARLSRDYPAMRAYIHEAALRDNECAQLELGQEILAEVESEELRFSSARAELARVPKCKESPDLGWAHVEAELARFDGTHASLAVTREMFERMRREKRLLPGELAYLSALEGRLLIADDPEAAHGHLAQAIAEADRLGVEDVWAVKARNYAYKTQLMASATTSDAPSLLRDFAAAAHTENDAGCTLGAAIDGERLLAVVADAAGHTEQVFQRDAFRSPDFDPATVIPQKLIALLTQCRRVNVIALPPLFGAPRLLPATMAWSYSGPTAHIHHAAERPTALIIEDVRPPAALGLPELPSTWRPPDGISIKESPLRREEATPDRVRAALTEADFVEIHAHGFVDLGISDVSLLALSPQADGNFALTARSIASLHLSRAPFVTLAACQAAYTAPYLHEPWSLPYAFLVAGARGVLAPSTPIPNNEAGEFFRTVGSEILRGADPATVLRDERMRRRGPAAAWIDGVVLFD